MPAERRLKLRKERQRIERRGALDVERANRVIARSIDLLVRRRGAGPRGVGEGECAAVSFEASAQTVERPTRARFPVSTDRPPACFAYALRLFRLRAAQVPLRLTGDPEAPVAVREDASDPHRVGSGAVWRVAKKMLGTAIPMRFTSGQPFHAGASWAVMDAGVSVMSSVFSD